MCLSIVPIALAVAAPAEAQTPAEDAPERRAAEEGEPERPIASARDEEARSLFEAGALAYRDGHFSDAESYFRRAHELTQRPELLHNIATAAERGNRDRVALEAYREFLQQDPETPIRARVEVRIAALEAQLGADEPNLAPWILFGACAAVLVTGVALLGAAAADVATVESAARLSDWGDVAGAYERSEPLSIAGLIATAGGAVGLAIGLGWALAEDGEHGSSTVAVEVMPGGLAVRGTVP